MTQYFLIFLFFVSASQASMYEYDKYDRQFYRDVDPYARQFFRPIKKGKSKAKPETYRQQQEIRDAFGGVSAAECENICANTHRFLGMLRKGTKTASLISEIAKISKGHRENSLDLLALAWGDRDLRFLEVWHPLQDFGKGLSSHDLLSSQDKDSISAFLSTPRVAGRSASEKADLVRSVIRAPAAVRQNVLFLAQFFLEKEPERQAENQYLSGTDSWMGILATHGQEIDPESLEDAVAFLAQGIESRVQVWGAWRQVPVSERPTVREVLLKLLPKFGDRLHKMGELVGALSKMPSQERFLFPDFMTSLLNDQQGDPGLAAELTKVSVKEREELTRQWNSLCQNLPQPLCCPAYEAQEFVSLSLSERELAMPLLAVLFHKGRGSGSLIETLNKGLHRDRESLLIALRPILENSTLATYSRGFIEQQMKILSEIHVSNRVDVARHLSRLTPEKEERYSFGGNEDRGLVAEGLEVLGSIPYDHRSSVVSDVLQLCEGLDNPNLAERLSLVRKLQELLPAERSRILKTVTSLNAVWHPKEAKNMEMLMNNLRPLSPAARARLVLLANRLFPLRLQGYLCGKKEIFDLAQAIGSREIEDIMTSVESSFPLGLKSDLLARALHDFTISSYGTGSYGSSISSKSPREAALLSAEIARCRSQVDAVISKVKNVLGERRKIPSLLRLSFEELLGEGNLVLRVSPEELIHVAYLFPTFSEKASLPHRWAHGLSKEEGMMVLTALAEIHPNSREQVHQGVLRCLRETRIPVERLAALLRTIAAIHPEDREDVLVHGIPLFTEGMDQNGQNPLDERNSRVGIMKVMWHIPREDRDEVVDLCRPIFAEVKQPWERWEILLKIGSLSPQGRKDKVERAAAWWKVNHYNGQSSVWNLFHALDNPVHSE